MVSDAYRPEQNASLEEIKEGGTNGWEKNTFHSYLQAREKQGSGLAEEIHNIGAASPEMCGFSEKRLPG